MINQVDLMAVVEKHRDNGVVVPTMTGSRGWNEVSNNKDRDIPIGGAMGKASSFALGLALAQPDLKVFVFDGDGSLLMNLGTLVTIAEKAPRNLYHCVLENGVYAVTGGQPIPGVNKLSFAGMAKEAGYAAAFRVRRSGGLRFPRRRGPGAGGARLHMLQDDARDPERAHRPASAVRPQADASGNQGHDGEPRGLGEQSPTLENTRLPLSLAPASLMRPDERKGQRLTAGVPPCPTQTYIVVGQHHPRHAVSRRARRHRLALRRPRVRAAPRRVRPTRTAPSRTRSSLSLCSATA